MNGEEKELSKEIELWSFLGPFLLILTLIVLLLHPHRQGLLLPLTAILGVLLSWKAGQKGLILSLVALGGLLGYQLWTGPSEKIFWDLMLVLGAALTFLVTYFSNQEIKTLLRTAQRIPAPVPICEGPHPFEKRVKELEAQLENELQHRIKTTMDMRDALQQMELQKAAVVEENQKLLEEQKKGLEIHSTKAREVQALEKELATLRMANKQKELHLSQQASTIQDLQSQIALVHAEMEQSKSAIKEFELASDKKEELLQQQIKALESRIAELMQPEVIEIPKEIVEKVPSPPKATAARGKKETAKISQAPAKSKNSKPTKTNNWANAILSRWSESHDQNP